MILYILILAFLLLVLATLAALVITTGLLFSPNLKESATLLKTGLQAITRKTVYLVAVYSLIIGILLYIMIGWVLIIDANPIGIPDWIIPYWILTAIPGPLSVVLAALATLYLSSTSGRRLHCRQPLEGDWRAIKISEKNWRTADVFQIVKNEDGEKGIIPKRTSDIPTSSAEAKKSLISRGLTWVKTYEVVRYDEDRNIIYISDVAGLTGDELTAWQDSVEYAMTVLSYKAAKQSKLESEFTRRVDAATQQKVNHVIHVIADAQLGDDATRNELKKATESIGFDYLPQHNEEIAEEVGIEKPTDEDMNFERLAEEAGDDS